MKKSNLYTMTGDKGTTSLVGGQRTTKNDPRLEAYGTVDELNAHIGLLRQTGNRSEDDATVPPLHAFLLPGGTAAAAQAHICRTVCRRAERRICQVAQEVLVDENIMKFINRLSDYFFVLARFNNYTAKQDEIFWDKDCK